MIREAGIPLLSEAGGGSVQKYSEALVTTLVAKDRVLAHNPVGALYQAKAYYKSKLVKEEK